LAKKRTKIDKRREISGIILFAVAALLAVAYYWPDAGSGWLGNLLVTIGRGFFGHLAFALPLMLIFVGIEQRAATNRKRAHLRSLLVGLMLISVAAIFHLVTVDQLALQSQFLDSSGQLSAARAMGALWRTGVNPGLLGQGFVVTGGLIAGLLAQAMLAVAGPAGGLIITIAITLAFAVVIFNISYSQTLRKTAQALRQAPSLVDSAIQTQLQSRENRSTTPADFDLELPHSTAEETRRTLLQGWQDFWHRQSTRKTAQDVAQEQERSTQEAVSEHEPVNPSQLNPDEAKMAAFLNQSKLPYTLAKDSHGFLTITPVEGSAIGQPAKPATDPSRPDVSNAGFMNFSPTPTPIPATELIHPFNPPESSSHTDLTTITSTDPSQPVPETASRGHWADRTEPPAPQIPTFGTVTRKTVGGEQLPIEIPYVLPPLHLLRADQTKQIVHNSQHAIEALGRKLEQTLESFGVSAKVVHFTTGPTITRFELSPGPGVKVSKIVNLADDIALNLAAMGVRIEAPIPGKAAIGIEIPNKETTPVLLRGLLESPEFQNAASPLTAAMGRDIQGNPLLCELTKMPHLLIAGATGSGKSVCINSILMSILFKATPDQVKMIMVDPKVVELSVYNGIPHLLHPVVTDPKKAAGTLQWAVNEMVRRYSLFAGKSVRDIASYNASLGLDPDEEEETLPLILLVIDELSDLMATTPTEVEDAIARLTAMARAAGIHLIIATQRPSVDVITGVIKANIPSRIAFAVASQIDSRTILDMAGAEKLLGKGDMLYYPQSAAKPIRGQGAFITDAEVERVITHLKSLHPSSYDQKVADAIQSSAVASGRKDKDKDNDDSDNDKLLPQALQICVETGYASVSLLQRRMTVGYPRAARLIDRMHELGYIGGFEGSKPRKVLITLNQFLEMQMKADIDSAEDDE
jgi:DNA segregation ATPase FtsK/SpoIIIE-like protein